MAKSVVPAYKRNADWPILLLVLTLQLRGVDGCAQWDLIEFCSLSCALLNDAVSLANDVLLTTFTVCPRRVAQNFIRTEEMKNTKAHGEPSNNNTLRNETNHKKETIGT